MQRNECKPGTEVIIRGTIIRNDEPNRKHRESLNA